MFDASNDLSIDFSIPESGRDLHLRKSRDWLEVKWPMPWKHHPEH
jgi:hypothetical protein